MRLPAQRHGSLTKGKVNARILLANSKVLQFVCPTCLLGRQKRLGNLRKKKYC
jgi:hypothetical protein